MDRFAGFALVGGFPYFVFPVGRRKVAEFPIVDRISRCLKS